MNCSLCDNTLYVPVWELENGQSVYGKEHYSKLDEPKYKLNYVIPCNACFPDFVRKHNGYMEKIQDAKKSGNDIALLEFRGKLEQNWKR